MPDYVIQCRICSGLFENWSSRCPHCDSPMGKMTEAFGSENQRRIFFPDLLLKLLTSINTKLGLR